MYLIAIAWGYVVLMMAAAEATSATGSLLGAAVTLLLYGVLPLALLTYILGTPGRKRRRKAAEAAAQVAAEVANEVAAQAQAQTPAQAHALDGTPAGTASVAPDGSSQAPGAAVAAVGKKT